MHAWRWFYCAEQRSNAEELDAWLLAQVQKDEQLLADALSQSDGHPLELPKDSLTYVPFLREPPDN